jgi:hypothetical protein
MVRNLCVFIFIMMCASIASADSWDSNQNINRATDAASSTYKSKGIPGVEGEAKNCYAGLDTTRINKNVGRDVEYCIAFEIASALIDQRMSVDTAARSAYLNINEITARAVYHLEKVRIVTLPENLVPYFGRFSGVKKRLPERL